ncbi:MAG: S9 family peptidase [Betaproteobacteria bacterium]|nr:S9 family peptidase [Betaproteobacteria bacterium]
MATFLAAVATTAALWVGSTAAQGLPPTPLEAFFEPARLQSAQPSPSGRWLATQVLPASGGSARLVVMDLHDKEPDKVVATFERVTVSSFRWVNDELLIFTFRDIRNRGGDPRFGGLASVQRADGRLRLLIKPDFESLYPAPGRQPLEPNHSFLSLGEPGSDDIVIGEALFDANYDVRAVRPFVLNARSGARRSFQTEAPANAVDWVFDHRGRPRVAVTRTGDRQSLQWFDLKSQAWKSLAEFSTLDAPFHPSFVAGDDTLYVQVDRDDGTGDELRRFDFDTGKPDTEARLAMPGYSGGIGGVVDRQNGELLGLQVLTDARQTVWAQGPLRALQAKADARLPGRVNLLLCGPRCDQQDPLPVFSYSDRSPGEYLLYRPKTDQWQRLGAARPKIDPRTMTPTEFARIKARDGSDLPVWVTRPAKVDKPRAAVVLVHGGPWVRGREWEWESEAQFLASRGYVVIEPEFRGSTGYGDKHFRAGFRQWGQSMQDDVSDALRYAVDKGWVDAQRVCIAGASYGGYATLMGLAKDPDQYRCGVAWVAVSDPRLMFSIHWSDISPDAKRYSLKRLIGDPESDATMLSANSPLALAARIKAPLLLAYGGMDRRVPLEHGERMREALTKAGRPPEWVLYANEGHGWREDETVFDFWRRVEAFLAKHLAP